MEAGKKAFRAMLSGTCQPQKDRLYKKGTRTSAANRHSGWHGAVSAPVHGCLQDSLFYDPDPSSLGRGQLLSGVRRHQQNQSHSDKQSVKERPHGCTLPFTVCAVPTRRDKEGNRAGGNVAEQGTKGNFSMCRHSRSKSSTVLQKKWHEMCLNTRSMPFNVYKSLFVHMERKNTSTITEC